jgi:hypothetical protein
MYNLSKYQPAFDGTTTPWDDGIFGFLGEVTANFCTSIRLPPDVLTPIQVRAFTENYIRTHIDELNNAPGIFGPPPPNHAEATLIAVRGIIFLPLRYAPLLFQGRGYTHREVWDLLIPLLIDDNLAEDC